MLISEKCSPSCFACGLMNKTFFFFSQQLNWLIVTGGCVSITADCFQYRAKRPFVAITQASCCEEMNIYYKNKYKLPCNVARRSGGKIEICVRISPLSAAKQSPSFESVKHTRTHLFRLGFPHTYYGIGSAL